MKYTFSTLQLAFSSTACDESASCGFVSSLFVSLDDIVISCLSLESEDNFVFSEGSFGRDFLIGFLVGTGESTLATGLIFNDFFASKLNRGRKVLPLFASISSAGESFFRPSLGDLGRVVGIYINNHF